MLPILMEAATMKLYNPPLIQEASFLLPLLLIANTCSSAEAGDSKLCAVPGASAERAVLRIGEIDSMGTPENEPLLKAEHFGIRYTSNLIVADLAWDCRVSRLNELLKRTRACIVEAHGNAYVVFQIPNAASYQQYKSVEADFIRSECIERISPTLDLRSQKISLHR